MNVLTPAIAGVAATVEPPAAALFAWIFLSQRLTLVQIAGGLLVLAGVVLAQRATAPSPEAVAVELTP